MKCLTCNGLKVVEKSGNDDIYLLQDIILGYTIPCPKCQKTEYIKHYADQGIKIK